MASLGEDNATKDNDQDLENCLQSVKGSKEWSACEPEMDVMELVDRHSVIRRFGHAEQETCLGGSLG